MPPGAALPLTLVVIFVIAGLVMRGAPRVDVDVADGALQVRFGGWDRLWTLSAGVRVPLAQVAGISVVPRQQVPWQGLRLPGVAVPGLIRAGSYGTGANRDLWDVRTGELVLWIELEPGAAYRRLILQVDDPRAAAQRLRPVLGSFIPHPQP